MEDRMTLAALLGGLVEGADALGRDLRGLAVADLATDSRLVTPGTLFLALPGLRQDGRQFVADALARGAVAVLRNGEPGRVVLENGTPILEVADTRALVPQLAARFYGDASARLPLIGVTGTNGKSSVTHFVAQMLSDLGTPCGVVGTLGLGFPGALRESSHTTPDTLALYRELAALERQGARAVAMEVSSHALDQDRIAGLRFQGAVFTNLSRDHLDYHGDMAAYGRAKQRLFERDGLKFAVINLDDDWGLRIATGLQPGLDLVSFALHNGAADLRVSGVEFGADGIRAQVHYRGQQGDLACGLMGGFNLSNLLAACGVLLGLGYPLEVVLARAHNLRPVPGRMQRLAVSGGPRVIVDYAHTPDALDQVLQACAMHRPRRIWCLFGCGGDRDRGKRPLMAAVVARHGAFPVVTDDNPRSEDPRGIVQEILSGLPSGTQHHVCHDREQAIVWALGQAESEDIVLIAGKGHETYQDIQGIRRPFSDVEVATRILRQQGRLSS